MTRAEFRRLVKRGVLTLVFHNAETGVVTAATTRGYKITLRPDLPGLPVVAQSSA